MKTIIFYSNCVFPISFVTAAIHTNKLADFFEADNIWSILPSLNNDTVSKGKMVYMGKTKQGTKVAAFNTKSNNHMIKNIVFSFFRINNIDNDQYMVKSVNLKPSLHLTIGSILLKSTPLRNIGKRFLEKYLKKNYPEIVKSAELDCTCQIADN